MYVAALLATLVICVTSSNTTVSPVTSLSFPVFTAQYVVFPRKNILVNAAVTPKFAVARYYGDVIASTLTCQSSSGSKILKAKPLTKVTTKLPPLPSVLSDSVSDFREVILNGTSSPAQRSNFNLQFFLDTTFVVSCFAFLFNTAIVLLISFLIELNCDVINENDDEMFDALLVPNQKVTKTVTFKVPSKNHKRNANALSTKDATMHKAVKVQLNLDVYSIPVICLPKLPTLNDNEESNQRASKLNIEGASSKPLRRNPIAGAFNASVISTIKKSIEKRVCRMNIIKRNINAGIKQTVTTILECHYSSDC